MGGFLRSDQGYGPLFDPSRLQGQSAWLLVWYIVSIGLVIWAIAALAMQNPDAISPAAIGWLMPLLTSLVHISVLIVSYSVIPGFVPYPVGPRALFASLDMLTGVLLGLTIGGLAANSLALLMISNGLLVLPYALACYKYYSIVSEIRVGKRSETTGALVR